MKLPDEFHERLRAQMRDAIDTGGWTRKTLASASGYSLQSLNLILQGRNRMSRAGAKCVIAALRAGPPAAAPEDQAKPLPLRTLRPRAKEALSTKYDGDIAAMARALQMTALALRRFLQGGRLHEDARERLVAIVKVDVYGENGLPVFSASASTRIRAPREEPPPSTPLLAQSSSIKGLFSGWCREARTFVTQLDDEE